LQITRELPEHESERYCRRDLSGRQCEQHWDNDELDGRGEATSDLQLDARGKANGCHKERRKKPRAVA
jgi:hypothetical protein